MFIEKHPLLLDLEKAQREMDRIKRGPIPVEAIPKRAWTKALIDAETDYMHTVQACSAAGIPIPK